MPVAMEPMIQETMPPKIRMTISAAKKAPSHSKTTVEEAPGEGGLGNGKYRSKTEKKIPVISPAARKGKKNWINLAV